MGHFFIPLQPGFKRKASYYVEKQDVCPQKRIPLLFYQFRLSQMEEGVVAIPDGCMDIIFCCDEDEPNVFVYGSVLKSKHIPFQTGCDYFGVRLMPCYPHFRYPMKELIDAKIPLQSICSNRQKDLFGIFKSSSFTERIELLKNLLHTHLYTGPSPIDLVSHSLTAIYQSKGMVSMKELALQLNYSTRYVRKKFEAHVGITPKLYSQIIRFQFSLQQLSTSPKFSLDANYYDQSHAIHEFKKFTNMTVNEFRFHIL